jgi:hypothetical protein
MIRSMNQAAEARLPRASPTPPTDLPLGWFGRIAVVVLVLIGGFVGAGTQLGLIWLPIYVPFAAVGALLAIRRPRTSIGWLLLAQGWMFAIILAPVTATVRQFADGSFDGPSGILAAIQGGSGPATFYLYAVLATIFPTGRLPAGRWGWLGRAALAAGLALVLAGFVTPMINVSFATVEAKVAVRNPIALFPDLAIWRVITLDTTFFPIVVLVAAAAVSLLVRLRHARGTERQQLRWFAASIAFAVAAVAFGVTISTLFPGSSETGLAWVLVILAFSATPIAVGLAVLRYRLYEIDRIISRTLGWALVTGLLGATFAGLVVGLQALSTRVTGGNTLAVAASTLVVAALFQPLRRRVQGAVDRRFNRARYDARHTTDTFARHVRNELDLGQLRSALIDTAGVAVRPVTATVWLRGASR